MSHQLENVKISRDDAAWEIIVEADVPAARLAFFREEALKEMQRGAKLDGFRPGKAPIERIVQIYGEVAILKQAAEHAIQHELPELLAAEKAMIIESPRVQIDEPKSDSSLHFAARAALAPSVELPDYKKIADKHNATKEEAVVSDEEHAQAMQHLQRERARIEKLEAGVEQQKASEESRAMKAEELPALDDAFVQSLGYEDAAKFSEALRANIKNEKEMQAREKRRAGILDDLVKDSTIAYPAALREYELDEMEARMKSDLEQMHTTVEAYLAQIKKTREQLRAEWKDGADKRAKVRLILAEIARKENIDADEHMLGHELEHARKLYPAADSIAMRSHIVHAMRNEAVLQFLETGDPQAAAKAAAEGHEHHD